jgi:hypothetical protein
MKLTKEKASFLKIFASLTRGLDLLTNSVIIDVKGNEATFTQYGVDYFAIVSKINVENSSGKDFKVKWNTSKLFSLLEAVKYDAEILPEGIKTETGVYTLENFDIKEPTDSNADLFSFPNKTIVIDDFYKLIEAKSFLDQGEDQYSYMSMYKDKFVGLDKTVGFQGSFVMDEESMKDFGDPLYLHRDIIKIFPVVNDNREREKYEISFYGDAETKTKFWSLKNVDKNVTLFLNYRIYPFVDLNSPEMRERYDHKEFILFSRDEFYEKLKIMYIFASNNPNKKIYLHFKDKKLCLENRNISPMGSDYISCVYPESFEDRSLAVDSGYLLIFEKFLGDTVKICIDFDKAPIKFETFSDNDPDTRIMFYCVLKQEKN